MRVKRSLAVYSRAGLTGLAMVFACSLAAAQVANDTCTTAQSLGTGTTTTLFSNVGAVTEVTPPDDFQIGANPGICTNWFLADSSNDVWYSWTATTDQAEIELCDATATLTDTRLEVYSACPASLATLVACDDDGCAAPALNSQMTFATSPGSTYLIRVGSFTAGTTGMANLNVTAVLAGVSGAGVTVVGDDYTLNWTNPAIGAAGDSILINSDEPGVTNPIATLAFPATSYMGSLLPANQGSSLGVSFSIVFQSGVNMSAPVVVPASFNPFPGDDCSVAIALGTGDIDLNYDNSGATTSPEPTPNFCPSGGTIAIGYTFDIWRSYVADKEFTQFTLTGQPGQDPIFSVYASCADAAAGNALDCEDRGVSGGFTLQTTPGDTYIVRIGADNNATPAPGPGLLEIRSFDAATNDECGTATALGTGSLTMAVGTVGATTGIDPDPAPCPSAGAIGNFSGDVWFTWTADMTGALIEWEGNAPLTNPVHAVYATCGDAVAGIAIDCEDRGNPNFLSISTMPGQTYIIRLASDSTTTLVGTGELRITSFGTVANDECLTATALGTGDVVMAVSSLGATTGADPGPSPCPSHPGAPDTYDSDIWFSWVADESLALFEWEGGSGINNPVHAVYANCADAVAGIAIDCEDGGNPNLFTTGVTIGNTYFIRLANDSATVVGGGLGELRITSFPPAPNDECLTATALGTGNVGLVVDTAIGGSTGAEPTCSIAGSFNNDLWYSWVADVEIVDVIWEAQAGGGITDPVLAMYDTCGDAAAGIDLACIDAGNPVVLGGVPVVVGDTYFIRVANDAGGAGLGSLMIIGQQSGVMNLSCTTTGPNDYSLTWMDAFGSVAGDTFVVNSNEPGVANPIYSGVVGTDPNSFSDTLLMGNQGLSLAVTFTVEVTTSTGVGASQCFVFFNPQPSDECVVPLPIGTGNQVVNYELFFATPSPEPDPNNCGQATNFNEDLWLEWTADWPMVNMAIVSGPPMTDDVIALYEDCAAAAANTPLACQDGGTDAEIDVSVNVGQTYVIRVGNDDGQVGMATLTISAIAPPVDNLVCGPTVGNATTITWDWPTGAMAGDTVSISSTEPGVTNPVLVIGFPTNAVVYNLSAANAGSSLAMTFEAVYTTGAAVSAAVLCSDVFNPIVNNDCANAESLMTPYPIVATANLGAASASGEPSPPCNFASDFNEDAYYEFTPALTVNATIQFNSAVMTDPVVAVYEDCANVTAGTALACNDGAVGASSLTVTLNGGSSYIIRVANDDSGVLGDGVLTIDAECLDVTNFGADFDCVAQVVTLAWEEGDAYSSLALTANGVPTTVQPTPLGAGAANGQIETMPPLNAIITYELTATCASGGTSVVTTTVDTTVPTGATNLILNLENPTSQVNSGAALSDALTAAGQMVVVATDQDNPCIDQLFDQATNIWVVEGTFPDNVDVSAATGDRLFAAVNAGKNVYLEGGDHWGFNPILSQYDQVDGVDLAVVADGDDSLTSIQGFDAPIANLPIGTAFPLPVPYAQNVAGNDFTDQLVVASVAVDPGITSAEVIFRNFPDAGELPYVIGIVAKTVAGPTTIAASFEFGGFGQAADRDTLIALYLNAFGGTSQFRRGDCNNTGTLNLPDAIFLLNYLFPNPPPPQNLDCEDACDVNDSGGLEISDAILLLNYLFPVGPPPPIAAPGVVCGIDPTPDGIGCAVYSFCP